MNSIEIFSGAGGLAKGLENAGLNHKALVELNGTACRTLSNNYPASIIHNIDIRDFSFNNYEDIDLLAGGPPCQPFSIGGRAKGNLDERDMFPMAIKAIRMLHPKVFLFENVKGLLRPLFSQYFNYILKQLRFPTITNEQDNIEQHLALLENAEKGLLTPDFEYDVKYKLVDAADYGVPQNRERVIIIGFRKDLGIEWSFPEPTHSKEALNWSKYVTGDYWERHNLDMRSFIGKESAASLNYGLFPPSLQPWRTIRDATHDLPSPSLESENIDYLLRPGAREYPKHKGSDFDMPSKTIKAGVHGVPGGENMIKFIDGSVRYFTIGEAKRIQTFPDDYKISGSWTEIMRQLGNAVPVKLAEIMALSIVKALSN